MLLILFFSMELTAQTKLIVFSENNDTFIANINSDNRDNEGNNFFEFSNVNDDIITLKIELKNNLKLKKSINLIYAKQNIYSISNENGFYEIRYRGNYHLNEKLPDFGYDKDWKNKKEPNIAYLSKPNKNNLIEEEEEVDINPSKLININNLLESLKNKTKEEDKTKLIIAELQKGMFNCRQLKFTLTKVELDSSKLEILQNTSDNCIDKENFASLTSSFESELSKVEFMNMTLFE